MSGNVDRLRHERGDVVEVERSTSAMRGFKKIYTKRKCPRCGGRYVGDEVAKPGPRNWTPLAQYRCEKCSHGLIVVYMNEASAGAKMCL